VAKAPSISKKTGYWLSLALDLREVGIASDQPFLREMVFHVNALGTAHGKVRSAWQGSESLPADQKSFRFSHPFLGRCDKPTDEEANLYC
jgi:hypothetical protein